jgi:hypothetical protein
LSLNIQDKALSADFYDAEADRYCYAGTTVLKNKLGLRAAKDLADFEALSVAIRSEDSFHALPRPIDSKVEMRMDSPRALRSSWHI